MGQSCLPAGDPATLDHTLEEEAESHDSSLGRGVRRPLLSEHISGRQCNDDLLLLEDDGQLPLRQQLGGWRASAIVLGFECLESIAYFGINSNLVLYFIAIFHETNAASAAYAATWYGTGFFSPLLGAVISDTYLGNYWTTIVCTVVYLLGMIVVTVSASLPSLKPSPCVRDLCPSASTTQVLMFFFGLYLVAFGSGGIKPTILPLGVGQFWDDSLADRERRVSFFSFFYLSYKFGNLIASTVLVWMEESVSWALGYAIATFCLALGLGGLLLGGPIFKLQRPCGSPLKSVIQVLVASFRKFNLQVPSDSTLLYEENRKDTEVPRHPELPRTDEFRFLDKAATVCDSDASNGYSPWRLCTVTQVGELKILLRLLPIWANCIIYAAANNQEYTTFIEQGNTMNRRIAGFIISPASLLAFKVFSLTLWTVICNKVVIPMGRRCIGSRLGLSQLLRIGVGRVLMVVAMVAAALLERKRLERARLGISMGIAWQLPQHFIIGGSEAFSCIGQMEFFYEQGPDTMKSMSTAFYLLSFSLGSYLSSLIISLVTLLTGKRGWLPESLNDGHLDYFFWCLAALSLLNFLFFIHSALRYRLKRVVHEG